MKLEEKRESVKKFFDATGETYDHIVKVCTFGIDGLWKKAILSKLDHPHHLLDLACGTGILTFAMAQRYPECQLVGVDITEGYLKIARRKATDRSISNVQFVHSWAEEYVSDQRFDCITSSYLAKYADLPSLIKKTADMLKPGGLLLFHDFTYPQNRLLASAWEFYFKVLLQKVGSRVYPEWRDVFYELPGLVRETTWVEGATRAMRESGLVQIEAEVLAGQGATLVTGRKRVN